MPIRDMVSSFFLKGSFIMNQTTDQELKDAFIAKTVEYLIATDTSNQSAAAQVATDDLKGFLSEMIVFHHVGKK